MQCSNCKSTDLEKSVYDYYICNNCGNIHYEGAGFGKKKNPLNEYYFIAVLGTVITIVVILILLFMTAVNRKGKVEQSVLNSASQTDKK